MAFAHSYKDDSRGVVSALVDGLLRGITQISATNRRLLEVERLQSLSDEALKARGLRRDDIARFVFRDVFWQ